MRYTLPPELLEQLAAIEHERWADWQRYMHSKCATPKQMAAAKGDLIIPAHMVQQWERQIATPYADLSEREKNSDREQVERYAHLILPATLLPLIERVRDLWFNEDYSIPEEFDKAIAALSAAVTEL